MPVIKYLKLPFSFDAAAMQAEVAQLETGFWKMHYNKKHYTGDWSIIPLRAVNGDPNITYSVHTTSAGQLPYADTPLLAQCPYITTVLNRLQCTKTSVRLMKLDAGAVINNHCDQDMAYEQGEIRIHIPVQTNSGVAFYIQEERIPMAEGECWYLNLQLMHRVRNDGSAPRIHLVIDCMVNDWVHTLFGSAEITVKQLVEPEAAEAEIAAADREKVIAELLRLGTPEALHLAASLRNPPANQPIN